MKKHAKRPKSGNKGAKIKNTRQNKRKRTGTDVARNKLKQSRYEEQAEERKNSNSAYSNAAETEVETVKKAAVSTKNKLLKKKAKTKEVVEETFVKHSAPGLEPKTASRQKRKLALTRRENRKNKQVQVGKKKLQFKQTVVARKQKLESANREQKALHSIYGKIQATLPPVGNTIKDSGRSLSVSNKSRENPLLTKKKKNIPKQRKKNFIPKAKSSTNPPKTKQSLGSKSPFTKKGQIAKAKAKKKTEQQTRQRALEAVKKTVEKVGKLAKKAVEVTVRAAKALITSLAALVGGSTLIAVLLIVAVVAAIIASPFGLFFSGEDKTPEVKPITAVVEKINSEFDQSIQAIIDSNSSVDQVIIHYEGSNDGVKINNWPDVITIFAINTTMGKEEQMDVATIDTKRVDLIEKTFHEMNLVEYEIEEVETTDDDDNVIDTEYILHITITSKSAWDMGTELDFDPSQLEVLEEMMGGQLRPELMKLLGLTYEGLSKEEIDEILANLPEGDVGAAVVQIAMTRLGDPYSIPKRGQGNYTDCSHLTMWSFQQLGVTIPPTASTQAQFLYDNDMTVSQSELQPGDFVFWSYGPTDKFMSIGHCGFYVGGGMVIHASSVDMQVVIEPLFHEDKIVFFARLGERP